MKREQEIVRSGAVATTGPLNATKLKRKHRHASAIPSYYDDDEADHLLKKPCQVAGSYEDDDDDDSEEDDEDDTDDDGEEKEDNEEEEDSVPKLLEPLSKKQLITLLTEAASMHLDVANRIRNMAELDTAHRKIFVHGLGLGATSQNLIDAFRPYGEIEECKAVTDKVSGKSKGYGFVLFKTRAGAINALRHPQKLVGNCMTSCQYAFVGSVTQSQPQPRPNSNNNSNSNSNSNNSSQRKIFVGNVSAELDPKKLTLFFSRYGDIEEGPLGLDTVTGKPKGFCFFIYKNAKSVKRALHDPYKSFEGHVLHCQKANDGPKPKPLTETQNKQQQQHNIHTVRVKISKNTTAVSSVGQPAGAGLVGYNHAHARAAAAASAQAYNPVFAQALAALLAVPGAAFGLSNLPGALGTAAANVNPGASASGTGFPVAYGGGWVTLNPAAGGGYGNQGGYQKQNQQAQAGQAAQGRGQIGAWFNGVGPYLGL